MGHTEPSTKSWFSRIGESIKGVLFGILLFAVSFPLLYWNEGRAVKQSQALKDGAAAVVTVPADEVDTDKEGFLIHLVGQTKSNGTLVDEEFELHAKSALRLKRTAEMYQWKEIKEETKEKKAGGSEKTTVTYSYEKVWSKDLINSSSFREEGHDNPTDMPYRSRTKDARKSTVGAFKLGNLVAKLGNYKEFPVEEGVPRWTPRSLPPNSKHYPKLPRRSPNPLQAERKTLSLIAMPDAEHEKSSVSASNSS